jgi:hypothetical protein
MKYAPIIAIANAAVADGNSAPIPAQDLCWVSAQVVATGTAAATVKIQASNDNPVSGTGQAPTNWTDIASASATVSGAGTALIPKTDLCYQWIRVSVSSSSGAGNLQVNVKVIGF